MRRLLLATSALVLASPAMGGTISLGYIDESGVINNGNPVPLIANISGSNPVTAALATGTQPDPRFNIPSMSFSIGADGLGNTTLDMIYSRAFAQGNTFDLLASWSGLTSTGEGIFSPANPFTTSTNFTSSLDTSGSNNTGEDVLLCDGSNTFCTLNTPGVITLSSALFTNNGSQLGVLSAAIQAGEPYTMTLLTQLFTDGTSRSGEIQTVMSAGQVQSVPGPIAGAGLPGLFGALAGLWALARRRRRDAQV